VRAGPQSEDGQGSGPYDPAVAAAAGGSGDSMTDRGLWPPWIRAIRLIRSILEVRRDEVDAAGVQDHAAGRDQAAREDSAGRMFLMIGGRMVRWRQIPIAGVCIVLAGAFAFGIASGV